MPFSLLPAGETPLFFFFFGVFFFLLDGVEPHSENIILTAFSSSFVKYVPMWTTTREKKIRRGFNFQEEREKKKKVAEAKESLKLQLFFFLFFPKVFRGVFSPENKKNKFNRTLEVLQLGRECDRRGLAVSQGLLQYVYSSGPSSPMEAFRTGGERSRRCVHEPRKVSESVDSRWTFQQGV